MDKMGKRPEPTYDLNTLAIHTDCFSRRRLVLLEGRDFKKCHRNGEYNNEPSWYYHGCLIDMVKTDDKDFSLIPRRHEGSIRNM
jgi:hypothetical protein